MNTSLDTSLVLLSFDTEEFDVPKEHNVPFSLEKGIEVSVEGTLKIIEILHKTGVKATFFCTGNFIKNAPNVIDLILNEGHEIACHGVDHWRPDCSDPMMAKQIMLEEFQIESLGYRQPRMFSVNDDDIEKAGYIYNSSLNPAIIPGRYIHINTPRTYFMKNNVLQIPASVTPILRIPLFWLSLHNFPESLYLYFVKRVLKHDGYFTTYFHPWEFVEIKDHPEWKIPYIIKNNSGIKLCERLTHLIQQLQILGCTFITYGDFARTKIVELNQNQVKI